jgi:hypothetical protein
VTSSNEEISNSDVFLAALHDLGGSDEFIDVEAVFVRCFQLAPQRFAWRTRQDLPDYKKCSKALRDAEARKPSLLVKTGDSFGRQLSVYGQKWIKANAKRLHAQLETGKVVPEPKRRPRSRMLAEAESSPVFLAWTSEHVLPPEKWRMAELLRCSPDSDTSVWRTRLQALLAAAHSAGRKDLLEFLYAVSKAQTTWFGGDVGHEA